MRIAISRKAVLTANLATKHLRVLTIPTDKVIAKLIDVSDKPWFRPVAELLDSTGLRVGELVGTDKKYQVIDGSEKWTTRRGLTIGDVSDLIDGKWIIRDVITVVGKGSKRREIPLGRKAKVAIGELIELYGGDDTAYLLVPLTARTIQKEIKAAKESAGLKSKITPHSMRHRVCTKLVRAGKYKEAQMLAGHSDPKITIGTYTHVTMEDIADAVEAVL